MLVFLPDLHKTPIIFHPDNDLTKIDSLWKMDQVNSSFSLSQPNCLHLLTFQWEVCFCSEPGPGTTKRGNFLWDPKNFCAAQNLCGINHHSLAMVYQPPSMKHITQVHTKQTVLQHWILLKVTVFRVKLNKIVLASHPEPLADHSCQIRRKQIAVIESSHVIESKWKYVPV